MRAGSLRVFSFKGTSREMVSRLIDTNRDRLTRYFADISLHPEDLAIPERSYVKTRRQYSARPFLEMLEKHTHSSAHALGLVDLDLFAPSLNFIFGTAQFGGNAIVALPRLRRPSYGLPDDDSLFFERASKEVVHELGHVLGLRHCTNHCVMQFSNSLFDTDRKPASFCQECLLSLE
ncbi:MAG: archaemetzincin family Zn-dependent metalloprotease [Promethearchaeota archaeon]